jgi:hypothetical protein
MWQSISYRATSYDSPNSFSSTLVNKPPVNAPIPSGWHHAHVADPLEKERELARRRTSMTEEENMALARRFLEARVARGI